MEPIDLTQPLHDGDRLESLLRQPAPALLDDGFSTRVLAALPAPKTAPAVARWQRPACYVAGTIAGLIFAATRGATLPGLAADADRLAAALAQGVPSLLDPAIVLAVTIAALSLVVAFGRELQSRLFS